MKGYSDELIGLQYGDEGKARIIDNIAQEYDVIVRFNGGTNAGHTLEFNGNKIVLHQVPSGIFHPNMLLYQGSGCVVHAQKNLAEIKKIEALGITLEGRLRISEQATLIQPHHVALDKCTGEKIGTTSNGIGPAYADRALRSDGKTVKNVRLGDVLDDSKKAAKDMYENARCVAGVHGWGLFMTLEKDIEETIAAVQDLKQYICNDPLWLTTFVEFGKKVLFEGAQAVMLDVTRGTVPYVTSSNTGAGSAYVGGDLAPRYHRKTIGVAKLIMSRVGNGPFASELGGKKSEDYCNEERGNKYRKEVEATYDLDALLKSQDLFDVGIALRILGNEYGSTTGRPRRMGMFDLVMLQQNCRLQGVDELYLTKLDQLSDFARVSCSKGIPMVHVYVLDGKTIEHIPGTEKTYRAVTPVVMTNAHIPASVRDARTYESLPEEAKQILQTIETYLKSKGVNARIAGVGVGPQREQFITF